MAVLELCRLRSIKLGPEQDDASIEYLGMPENQEEGGQSEWTN